MTEKPVRVGIVVRTKNRPWFLTRALEDIAAQTWSDWAVVVVNDGGDRSRVESALAAVDADVRRRVAVIHGATTRGRAASANAGVEALDSEFVVLHDDDDLWHPSFLARTVEWLEGHPDDAGVVVRTDIVYERERDGAFREVGREPMWPGLEEITYSDMLRINRAVPISFLYRRSLHDEVGGYAEELDVVEDWEFNLRVTLRRHVGFLDGEPLAFWMQRSAVAGDLGNSVVAMRGAHDRFDKRVRDDALREWVAANGAGLPLYLTRFIEDEVARQLDLRRTLGQRLAGAVRDWRRARRMR